MRDGMFVFDNVIHMYDQSPGNVLTTYPAARLLRPAWRAYDALAAVAEVLLSIRDPSALAAALFTGLYAGISIWLLTEQGRNTHAEDDLLPAVIGTVGGFVLVFGALFLERACRVPPPPPSSDPAAPGWAGDGVEPDAQEEAGA